MSTTRQLAAALRHVKNPRTRKRAESALTAAIWELQDSGRDVPCSGMWDSFQSEYTEVRAMAVPLCRRCPVLAECRAAAVANHEKFGVWGGKDRTHPDYSTQEPTQEIESPEAIAETVEASRITLPVDA